MEHRQWPRVSRLTVARSSHRFQVGAGDFLLLRVVRDSLQVRGPAVMFPGLFRRFPGAVLVGFEVQIDVSLGRHVRSSEARNQKKGSYERRSHSEGKPGGTGREVRLFI